MAQELEKLLSTVPGEYMEEVERDFDGFQNLFGKFVSEPGPSIHWGKIEKLPPHSVSMEQSIKMF